MVVQRTDLANTARQIVVATAQRALQDAGVAGVVPTPLEPLRAIADVDEVIDISRLGELPPVPRPRFLRRLLGALHFKRKVILLDTNLPRTRTRWISAHELGHGLLPWHREENAYLDDQHTLSMAAVADQEREANLVAAHLLFQGAEYLRLATSYRHSLDVPLALADDFVVSRHASIRYFTEHHPSPTATAVARLGPSRHWLRIYDAFASPSFIDEYGHPRSWFPRLGLPLHPEADLWDLAEEVTLAMADRSVRSVRYTIIRDGREAAFRLDLYFNGYSVFAMLSPWGASLGRRVSVVETIE